eukprot:ANDGO_02941.mRNA.1 hypothetical protein
MPKRITRSSSAAASSELSIDEQRLTGGLDLPAEKAKKLHDTAVKMSEDPHFDPFEDPEVDATGREVQEKSLKNKELIGKEQVKLAEQKHTVEPAAKVAKTAKDSSQNSIERGGKGKDAAQEKEETVPESPTVDSVDEQAKESFGMSCINLAPGMIPKTLLTMIATKHPMTHADLEKLIPYARPLSEFKKGAVIGVWSYMQRGYMYQLDENPNENFAADFAPAYDPAQLLLLGIFEGHFFNDCILEYPREWFEQALQQNKLSPEKPDPTLNCFGVKSRLSLKEWKERGWVAGEDRRGWMEWYFRYWLGRRDPEVDKFQIEQWNKFTEQQLKVKEVCEANPGDRTTLALERQHLLQWSHEVFAIPSRSPKQKTPS